MNSLSYKKILLSISGGAQARNLLQNDFYKLLKESGCKIIIVTSAHDDARFIKEFGGQNVTMLPLLDAHEPFLDYVFGRGNSFLIYNRNTVRLSLYDYVEPPKTTKICYVACYF
jgi:hypothetical protein